MKKRFLLLTLAIAASGTAFGQGLKVNDLDYFEARGANVFVFSNEYNGMFFDEKTSGIELIHHGVRTGTGGAVRLQNTPEQWDQIPAMTNRKVNKADNSIEVTLRYDQYNFDSRIKVKAKGNGVSIEVFLDKPVPEVLAGKAGFNFELLPSAYWEHDYLVDGKPGIFPRYPSGNTIIKKSDDKIPQIYSHTTFDDLGRGEYIVPEAFAKGHKFVLAPDSPENMVTVSSDNDLLLFDGRNLAQNGWFIMRTIFPAGKTGKVVEWYFEPNRIDNWVREPNIGFSQVGYTPAQKKVSVIELDPNDQLVSTASIYKVNEDGKSSKVFTGDVKMWGRYNKRYNYAQFDFSDVKEAGVYYIEYGKYKTNVFPIAKDVYETIWQPTMDVWLPVQMDHMKVNEGYRVWHGEPYRDDALQAPTNWKHFDGYTMGDTTGTRFKPYEHIPGLGVGGWFDAGDFDIQLGSHYNLVSDLVTLWEVFKVDRDETFIDQKLRYVDIHRPDGKADVLQQIEHGALQLVAQVENIGFPIQGIIVPNLHQYHHLGDAGTITDGLPYNPNLKPYETDGKSSGTMDDRWAFTNRRPMWDMGTAEALAAASRALKELNPDLSQRAWNCAMKLWNDNQPGGEATRGGSKVKALAQDPMGMDAAMHLNPMATLSVIFQFWQTSGDEKWKTMFEQQLQDIINGPAAMQQGRKRNEGSYAPKSMNALVALPYLPYLDQAFKDKLKPAVEEYAKYLKENDSQNNNPYMVPISGGGWAGNGGVIRNGITNYYLAKNFPDIISPEYVFNSLNFLFGCHPYHNLSFVTTVGTKSKKLQYGNNRADFSVIAGGVVPGLLSMKPDFMENKDDWPFFWGENEVVLGTSATYVFLAHAADELAKMINK